jgi:hypothetical protein
MCKPVFVRRNKVSGGRGAEIRIEPADAGRHRDWETVCVAHLLACLPSGKMVRPVDRFSALFRMPCRAMPMQKCVPMFTEIPRRRRSAV